MIAEWLESAFATQVCMTEKPTDTLCGQPLVVCMSSAPPTKELKQAKSDLSIDRP
jgi:hypothetical protein